MSRFALDLLVFAVILGGAVVLHEVGHLIVALAGKVRILETGIGLPPRLATLGRVRGTIVSLNWIPLGGFIRPAGEFGGTGPGDFAARPKSLQATVLLAGPAANLLAAMALLTLAFVLGGPDGSLARVIDVSPGSPAEAAGLRVGDVIHGRQYPGGEGELSLRETLTSRAGSPIRLALDRAGVETTVELTPRTNPPPGEGPAGFTTMMVVRRYAPAEAAAAAATTIADVTRSLFDGLRGEAPARLVGPLGLKQASDQAVDGSLRWSSAYPLLYVAALIQLGLALTNLLPIPALDGGRLTILGLDAMGLHLAPRLTRAVVAASAVGLIVLMAALTVRDLVDPLVR
ncbi:MAG TPA: M50 family metallopeptidase [Anaerolineales bacterium]|nr:M50 family metallopeptidase [Anaerolineales bacterium]